MHVSGESLLNDGSAYVFYTIFKARYYVLFGIEGVGQAVDWGEGFKLFFQLALGGMCIGLAFGAGAVILLFALNRRLSGEDSLAQVVVTITSAYLAYFSSEVAGCSGIIAVLFLGVTVKALGVTMVNDPHLMMHFWEIVEWLLNTLLFTLAGGLWGYLMGDDPDTAKVNDALLGQKDWVSVYLLRLYYKLVFDTAQTETVNTPPYTGLLDPPLCPLDCHPLCLDVLFLPNYFKDWDRLELARSPLYELGRTQGSRGHCFSPVATV